MKIDYEKLKRDKILSYKGIGSFYLKPARKGNIYGFGKDMKPRYKYRIFFKPSLTFKEKVCK